MNPRPRVLTMNSTMEEAVAILRRRRIDPLPVINENGQIAGILTRSDLLKLLKGYRNLSADAPHEDTTPFLSENVKNFLEIFEKEFTLVNRIRTYYWLLFSLVFAITGFALAYLIILRVNLE